MDTRVAAPITVRSQKILHPGYKFLHPEVKNSRHLEMNTSVICLAAPFVFLAGWVTGMMCMNGNANTAGGGGGGGGCCFGGGEEYYAQPGGYGRGAFVNNGYSYGRRPYW
jgi:hypothetical protein